MIWRKSVTHPSEGKHPGFGYRIEPHDDFMIERDVAVPMRDGIKLYADIIRPKTSAKVPVILTYSPYGKHGLKKFLFSPESGVPAGSVSKYAVWEGPDPAYFVPHGYAVVNADARGSWYSEGDLTIWSDQEAQDGYDLVEWAARQPWSTGKVGMSGVSYLAIVQWRIAALNPPHLAAINPWEGWSDCYRERSYHGGIPETKMVPWAQWSTSFSLTRSEEFVEVAKEHPLLDDYWRGKSADLSKITAPAYIVADWGDQGLHTRGTIEGFRQASSQYKWLEVHGRKKWQYYYQPESRAKLRTFFDHFLKGSSDEALNWPRVRIEIRERFYQGVMRAEREWPLARQKAYAAFSRRDHRHARLRSAEQARKYLLRRKGGFGGFPAYICRAHRDNRLYEAALVVGSAWLERCRPVRRDRETRSLRQPSDIHLHVRVRQRAGRAWMAAGQPPRARSGALHSRSTAASASARVAARTGRDRPCRHRNLALIHAFRSRREATSRRSGPRHLCIAGAPYPNARGYAQRRRAHLAHRGPLRLAFISTCDCVSVSLIIDSMRYERMLLK